MRSYSLPTSNLSRGTLVFAIALASTAAPAYSQQPLNLGFEIPSLIAPGRAWNIVTSDAYDPANNSKVALDSIIVHGGKRSMRIDHPGGPRTGWAGVDIPGSYVAGKRVRLSGWIRTDKIVDGYAGLEVSSFGNLGRISGDSLAGRGPRGTTPWTKYSIDAVVDTAVRDLYVGVQTRGGGSAWFDDLVLEVNGKRMDILPGPPAPTSSELAWLRKNAKPFKTTEPSDDVSDLESIRGIVGDAHIVELGEGTHGTRDFFQAKHRMLEYLVEKMGFNIFALEANQLQTARVNQYALTGEGDARSAISGLFKIWKTEEVLAVVEWIRAYNKSGRGHVEVVGYDMQDPQLPIDSVKAFLSRVDPAYLPIADSTYQDFRESWRKGAYPQRDDSVFARWKLGARNVLDHLAASKSSYADRATAGEISWAIQNANVVYQSASLSNNAANSIRDSSMAANAEWALAQRPNSRMVIWAHNSHVARERGRMGGYLDATHGPDMRVFGFATYDGAYTAALSVGGDPASRKFGPIQNYPAPAGSVEYAMHKVGIPRFILAMRSVRAIPAARWLDESRPLRGIGFVASDYGFDAQRTARTFDALVFIDHTTPSRLLQ